MEPEPPSAPPAPADVELDTKFGLGPDSMEWLGIAREARQPGLPLGKIGGYELLEELGRGGQGQVYRALQPGTGRVVAIKRLAAGLVLDTRARDRFQREVEAVTRLRDPNIVTVHAAEIIGGHAILVMEFIDGRPFDRWSDAHREGARGTETILRSFASVCDGVAHAHQRGVIHRDIKPSNILVDGADVPHVVDFGVAAVVGEEARHTHTTGFLGTPAYAPPEQLTGPAGDVDTRADVYALGAVLWRALTGRDAFEAGSDLGALVDAVRAGVRGRPSGLRPALPHELDWILLKAMSVNPGERYPTVEALAADIRALLDDMPITAHPPSTLYLTSKFIRRNRTLVGTAGLALLMLVAFAASMATLAALLTRRTGELKLSRDQAAAAGMAAQEDRRVAEQRAAEALAAQSEAEHEAERARTTAAFLYRTLDLSPLALDAEGGVRPDITLRQVLDRAAERMDEGALVEHPDEGLGVEFAIAKAYRDMGYFAPALESFRGALRLAERVYGREHAETARCWVGIASSLAGLGRIDEATGAYERALAIRESVYGPDDPQVAYTLSDLGAIYIDGYRLEEAERVTRRALEIRLAHDGPESIRTAISARMLAWIGVFQGRYAESEQSLREVLATFRRLEGDRSTHVAYTVRSLGAAVMARGRYDEAEALLRESANIADEAAGADSVVAMREWHHLAYCLLIEGRPAEAEQAYLHVLTVGRQRLPDDHPGMLQATCGLAHAMTDQGRDAEAEPLFARVLSHRGVFHPSDTTPGLAMVGTGRCLAARGQSEEGLALILEGVTSLASSLDRGGHAMGLARRALQAAGGERLP